MEALQEYAERLMRLEQYDRPIPGFRLCDAAPPWAEPYAMTCPSAAPVPAAGK